MRAPSWWRVLGALLLTTAIATALCIAWLLRDPVPRFDARRGTITAVRTGEPTRAGAAVSQDVELTTSAGLTIRMTIRRHSADSVGLERRPLFLILGGHERGRAAVALLPDSLEMIFVALDYPFTASGRLGWSGVISALPAIRRALYDTPPSVSLALDHLLARTDVDTSRVELVGASFGAPFATIAAVRDQRVTRLWLAHAGGDLYGAFEQNLRREIPFAPARVAVAHLVNLLASGPRFTPERWIGQLSPRPLVMLNGEADERIPRRSVDALWNAAREPKELVWLPGKHMRGDRPEVISALVEAMVVRAAGSPVRQ